MAAASVAVFRSHFKPGVSLGFGLVLWLASPCLSMAAAATDPAAMKADAEKFEHRHHRQAPAQGGCGARLDPGQAPAKTGRPATEAGRPRGRGELGNLARNWRDPRQRMFARATIVHENTMPSTH